MATEYSGFHHFQVVTGIGECIVEALEATPAGAPDRVCIPVPGAVAWDDCQCGQLTITTTRNFSARQFPSEAFDAFGEGGCGTPYIGVDLVATIMRCVPGPDDYGNSPTCAALSDATKTMYDDAWAVWQAVKCCLRDLVESYDIADFIIQGQDYEGPEGGCAGSSLRFSLGYTSVCCG